MEYSGIELDLLHRENWIGIIGSREANEKELVAASRVAAYLISQGYNIVSGLALGIDAAAHEGAIIARINAAPKDLGNYGRVIAIVNTTKEQAIYPAKNRKLAEEVKRHGCILHPYTTIAVQGPGFNQSIKRLIERDLILAKMCAKIIAVSDNLIISGGTRYATNYGQRFGKEVYRMDSNLTYYKNPQTEECKVNWKLEFDLQSIV